MSILTRPLTYDDLVQTPDDNQRYEIIGGELYVAAAPIPEHQRLSALLHVDFFLHVEPGGLGRVYAGPIDVYLGDHDIVEPDLVFVSTPRLNIIKAKYIEGPPDIVVEILSLSTRARDETIKADLFARSAVPEFWIVDPFVRTIRVFALRDGRYDLVPSDDGLARSTVLDGFAVVIPALFAKV